MNVDRGAPSCNRNLHGKNQRFTELKPAKSKEFARFFSFGVRNEISLPIKTVRYVEYCARLMAVCRAATLGFHVTARSVGDDQSVDRSPSSIIPSPAVLRSIWPPALVILSILALWELYARFSGIKPTTLPAPSRVAEQIYGNFPTLVDNAIPTLYATILGFALSVTTAFVLSVIIDFFPLAKRALFPVFIISQTLPLVAIAPLVVLWFGFGLLPKILLVSLVTFFPMLVALVEGFESTDRDLQWLLHSMGASKSKVFWVARMPSAIPFFFTGLRISITYAVVGAIFAEYSGAEKGLGIYMLSAKNNFRSDLVLSAVTVSALLTLVLFGLATALQKLSMPWEKTRKETK